MRRIGIGRKLMALAEAEAVQRGCHAAALDTFSFEARGFYERLGYSVFGILNDCPPGHSRFYLTKRFGDTDCQVEVTRTNSSGTERPHADALSSTATPPIVLRPAQSTDLVFCRRITHDSMRWIVEQLFGWDEDQQVEKFARQWTVDEVRIITGQQRLAWWLQTTPVEDTIFLKQVYLDPLFQLQGMGARVMHIVIDEATVRPPRSAS